MAGEKCCRLIQLAPDFHSGDGYDSIIAMALGRCGGVVHR